VIEPSQLDGGPDEIRQSYTIGVIGAGGIVLESHLPAYAGRGWKIARIASRTRASAERAARDFDIPASSDRWQDVIADDAVEVVDVSLPPHLHREVCEAAFAAGKHVLVQKPMATTLEDARAIVRAAEQAGRQLAVNQNGRWDPAIRGCRRLIELGAFGQMVTASMELRTRQPWQSFWEDHELYPRLMLLGMSIHHLDQFRFLFGDPVEVTAITQRYPGQPWAGDSIASYALRYDDGFVAYGFDDGFPWTRDWSVRYRLEGVDAIAMGDIGWPTGGFSTLRYTQRSSPDTWHEPAFRSKWFPDAFAGTMGALFNAIATGDPAPTSGADNVNTMRLVEAAYRSADERRTVPLQEIE
jgi:predicted dehydrogenase